MKIAFMTLGCKVNQYETDKLKNKAEEEGFEIVDFESKADIYCINSCSVTNISQRKSRQMVSHAKSKNSKALVALIGCAVESAKDDLASLNADILLGNNDKEKFIEILKEKLKAKTGKIVKVSELSNEYNEKMLLEKPYDIREAVKIEDGCNNFCSYCIIPYLRGRVRSKEYSKIEKEVKTLISKGVKEIVLVGIEVASYGKDLGDISLIDVVERLNKIDGLERLRLSSIEPRFLTKDVISRLAKCECLCDHFHISMQSGCTETLKRMNRHYDKELLIQVCNNLKEYFPNCYIAVDVIVGFPGETEEEFNITIDTIAKMNLSELHVFKYSKRAYTRAIKMANQVDGNVKKKRSEQLLEISSKNKEKFLKQFLGKKVEVLFESVDKKNNFAEGLTKNYIRVRVKGGDKLCGTIKDVFLTSLEAETLVGVISEN